MLRWESFPASGKEAMGQNQPNWHLVGDKKAILLYVCSAFCWVFTRVLESSESKMPEWMDRAWSFFSDSDEAL